MGKDVLLGDWSQKMNRKLRNRAMGISNSFQKLGYCIRAYDSAVNAFTLEFTVTSVIFQ